MQRSDVQQYDLPDNPGVYLFRGPKREILYIGKATSLRDRVRSYFASDLLVSRSPAIVGMIEKATGLTWEETDSVLEALILEANLIKKHQPPYNVEQKDNKSFNYLVITNEDFPRVLVVRGRELFQSWKDRDIKHLFGPFPHSGQLKEALKLVRGIFPFRDKCTPQVGKPCFNRQIGLCPGVCSGETNKTEYARTIRNIVLLFSGKKGSLLQKLEREMKAAARTERFEDAARLRRQIEGLTHVRDVALIKGDMRLSGGGSGAVRIEGFDVAHTGGGETVGIMVVVRGGEVERDAIRRFRVRGVTNNDPAALAEIVSRRLNHPEWPLPRVFAIDGGRAQVRAIEKVLADVGIAIPVVGIVKDEHHRPKQLLGPADAIRDYQRDILLANNEAHRKVLAYHQRRRGRAMHG